MSRRRSLTPKERSEMIAAQGGLCGCGCGRPLAGQRTIAEHGLAVGLGNSGKPNSIWRWGCSYLKTVNEDNPRMNKADRQGGRKGQQARRAAGKTAKIPARPFGPSRGFDKTKRKRMNGTVETRS